LVGKPGKNIRNFLPSITKNITNERYVTEFLSNGGINGKSTLKSLGNSRAAKVKQMKIAVFVGYRRSAQRI
jgi:hypothetical protein